MVWSRDLPAGPSSVRVYRDSLGHWYASFVVAAQVQLLPATGRVIGVDWGVSEIATTTSDEHDLAALRARGEGRCTDRPVPAADGPAPRSKGQGPVQGVPAGAEAGGQGA
ncbi:hypothetical protein GCM10009546_66540 [Actinomadura livida]|uniref:Transposase n=1 Tax=Actinomadura livida TaxID=79909 RepID=A0ABN1FPQ9_9ACTN